MCVSSFVLLQVKYPQHINVFVTIARNTCVDINSISMAI